MDVICIIGTRARSFCATLLLVAMCATAAQAIDRRDETIRKAAISKMQEKLGGLRGTIGMGSRFTLLTEQMIDRWRPVRPGDAKQDGATSRQPVDPIKTNSVTAH